MNKRTKRLQNIEKLVEHILETSIASRESVDILYANVIERTNAYAASMPMGHFMRRRANLDIPSYESVGRARRRIFNRRPELDPSRAHEARSEMEEVYLDYVRGE